MSRLKEAGWISTLSAILADLPPLRDAACAGRHDLFDPAGENEPVTAVRSRHALAVEICADCPCLDKCRAWASTQRPEGGVVGGELPTPATRKETAA